MNKGTVLIVGWKGAVGSVVTQVCAQNLGKPFKRIVGVSRTLENCSDRLAALVKRGLVEYRLADISEKKNALKLIDEIKPELLLHVAWPYDNLTLMETCLEKGVNFLHTACYEPKDEANFRHTEEWAFHEAFRKAGLTAILGCGFDPGVSNAMTRYILDLFGIVKRLWILDCNGGSHGQTFATNFNPVINIRELMGAHGVKFLRDGQLIDCPSLIDPAAIHYSFNFEEIGWRELFLIYHEEFESFLMHFGTRIQKGFFMMTFGPVYIQCLRMLKALGLISIERIPIAQDFISPFEFVRKTADSSEMEKQPQNLMRDIGLLSDEPIRIEGGGISPLEFMEKVLPAPASLGESYEGKANISVAGEGRAARGATKMIRLLNICEHQECFRKFGSQAIATTTGIPAVAGAMMMMKGEWTRKPGVFNVEQLDNPSHFLRLVGELGLPIRVQQGDEVPQMPELF